MIYVLDICIYILYQVYRLATTGIFAVPPAYTAMELAEGRRALYVVFSRLSQSKRGAPRRRGLMLSSI